MESEADLIKRAAEGDTGAFRTVFEKHQQRVFNVCYKIAGEKQDAEDITQEVFIKVYRSLHLFRHQSAFSTWIYRIAVNLSFTHLRKNKKFRGLSLRESASAQLVSVGQCLSEASQPDKALEQEERERIIARVIGSLPEKQRMAILLQKYEEYSVQKIADSMDCSIASVQSLLQRAKKNLYTKLLPYVKKI